MYFSSIAWEPLPFLSLPTSFSWIRKYLIKLFFNHLLKEYSNTQLSSEPDMSDCFLPSLPLHSSLSVQFELDCLARKHRGIASKLGATAGTNKTGINLTPGKVRLCWSCWFDLTIKTIWSGQEMLFLLIIEWYIMMTILPCRTKIINFHRDISTSGLLCEEVHHILF